MLEITNPVEQLKGTIHGKDISNLTVIASTIMVSSGGLVSNVQLTEFVKHWQSFAPNLKGFSHVASLEF